MNNSSKTIIEHIPLFLDYCKKEGLSEKTQENYKRYLNKFISWLKKENKNNLLPHELTTVDIDYVEIDTVSLFKLWYNLSVMKNVTILIIPAEDKIIEFNT